MDKDSNIIANMNKFLLNNKKTTINLTKLNQNIEDLCVTLYQLDPEKEPHKYLCLSCIFGAFLGDSIGSCCEFSYENPKNHLNIFKYENGIFRPGEVTDDSEMAMSAAFAYIDIINDRVNECVRFDNTQNNREQIQKFMNGEIDVMSFDEYEVGSTQKNIEEIMSVADAICVS